MPPHQAAIPAIMATSRPSAAGWVTSTAGRLSKSQNLIALIQAAVAPARLHGAVESAAPDRPQQAYYIW